MPLFLLFLLAPIAEITLLITVGGEIGTLPVIALVVGTALIGAAAIRRQGRQVVATLQRQDMAAAPQAAVDGVALLIAGVCLITPGFLTDAFGLALLFPSVRRRLARSIARRAVVVTRASVHRSEASRQNAAENATDPPEARFRRRDSRVDRRRADDAEVLRPNDDD